jgi:FKBP-type peptidyl-prolyl cis-trans isomerase FkpA
MMKYILAILTLTIAVTANAQTGLQHTPQGATYQIFTHSTGEKIKQNDVITFQFIQKTDKDSVLFSTYAAGHPVQAQIQPSKNVGDLMDVFPLLALNDSALVKVPTDSIFKGHEDQRPAFFPKGSNLNFTLKIERIQSLNDAIAERNAAIEKVKSAEVTSANKYIADHKLVVKTTATGLKYVVTKPSLKHKPLKGDTLLVNYTGRTLDDKVFDSSIESVAKGAGLQQSGRTYEPIQVIVGTGGVIPGWDEGLLLLNEGSKATFVIPSGLAYGAEAQGDDIKPYSTLVFDVELVKIRPIKHAAVPAKTGVKKPLHKKKPVAKKATS